jgi:hypothetical protein
MQKGVDVGGQDGRSPGRDWVLQKFTRFAATDNT